MQRINIDLVQILTDSLIKKQQASCVYYGTMFLVWMLVPPDERADIPTP